MDERRQAIRWNVNLPVRYMGLPSHKEGAAKTLDLSMTGARIETVERHKPGDILDLMLDIPGVQNGLVCVEADVVWQNPGVISEEDCNHMTGVVFRKIRECHKQSILDYVIDNKSGLSGIS
jgi:hypothetical protein